MEKKKRRTLTVSTPFKLRTDERIRAENEMNSEAKAQPYEPLWL
jgi:hypothetical protein